MKFLFQVFLCFYSSISLSSHIKCLPKDVWFQMLPENLELLQKVDKEMFILVQSIFDDECYREKHSRYWVAEDGHFQLGHAQNLLKNYLREFESCFLQNSEKNFENLSYQIVFNVGLFVNNHMKDFHPYQKLSCFLLLKALYEALQSLKFLIPEEIDFSHGSLRSFIHLDIERSSLKFDGLDMKKSKLFILRYGSIPKFCLVTKFRLEEKKNWFFSKKKLSMSLKQYVSLADQCFCTANFCRNDFFKDKFLKSLRHLKYSCAIKNDVFEKHVNSIIFLIMLEYMTQDHFVEAVDHLSLSFKKSFQDDEVEELLSQVSLSQDDDEIVMGMKNLLFHKIMN